MYWGIVNNLGGELSTWGLVLACSLRHLADLSPLGAWRPQVINQPTPSWPYDNYYLRNKRERVKWDVWVGSGSSSRPWKGEGLCQSSCSWWIFWSEWLPQSFSTSSTLDCCIIPVDAVVCLLNMNCNAVLRVSLSHCLSVLTQSDFQFPLTFTHIHLRAILTGNLIHHSSLFLLWGPVLHLH